MSADRCTAQSEVKGDAVRCNGSKVIEGDGDAISRVIEGDGGAITRVIEGDGDAITHQPMLVPMHQHAAATIHRHPVRHHAAAQAAHGVPSPAYALHRIIDFAHGAGCHTRAGGERVSVLAC